MPVQLGQGTLGHINSVTTAKVSRTRDQHQRNGRVEAKRGLGVVGRAATVKCGLTGGSKVIFAYASGGAVHCYIIFRGVFPVGSLETRKVLSLKGYIYIYIYIYTHTHTRK
jgi:hypothetical protein